MRRNRVVRDKISAAVGEGAVDELERWNDGAVDSLEGYGLELDPLEAEAQEAVLSSLTLYTHRR